MAKEKDPQSAAAARAKDPDGYARTGFTGLYWPCGVSEIKHPKRKKAVPIAKGPSKYYLDCVCKYFAYLPPDWHWNLGLTKEQATSAGYDVDVAVFIKSTDRIL